MPFTLLHLDSSPMGEKSFSRKLTAEIVRALTAKHTDARVIRRDLAAAPFPHLDAATLGAFFTPEAERDAAAQAAAKLSDDAIAELKAADVIVLGAPMWNFGLPSGLKAWIDHVVRAGITFKYGANGPEGLLDPNTKVFVVSARGGVYSDGPAKAMDYQETYLKMILAFIGLSDVTFVRAEGVATSSVGPEKALQVAEEQARAALAKVA